MDVELDLSSIDFAELSVADLVQTHRVLCAVLQSRRRALARLHIVTTDRRSSGRRCDRAVARYLEVHAAIGAIGGNRRIRQTLRHIEEELSSRTDAS